MQLARVVSVVALAVTSVCAAETTKACIAHKANSYSTRPIVGLPEAAASGLTATECIDKCGKSPTCLAFHWTPQGACTTYATVYFRYSSVGSSDEPLPASGAVVGRCHVNGPAQVKGVVGSTKYYMSDAATPDICSYACDSSINYCDEYTWTDENGGTCYSLAYQSPVVPAPTGVTAISGEVLRCRTQADVEVVGSDIAKIAPRPDWRSCWGECRRTEGCKASTWTNENGGTCSLKKNFTKRATRKGSITNTPLPGRWTYGYY